MNSQGIRVVATGAALGILVCAVSQAQANFRPKKDIVLDTASQQVGNQLFTGGLFVFNQIRIDRGIHVSARGPNPLILVALGDVVVDGILEGDGRDGPHVNTLNSANYPAPGGIGGPAGGRGGAGSPQPKNRSLAGQRGQGPMGIPGLGGIGGSGVASTISYAAGGGGGSFATIGDPHFVKARFDPKTRANVPQIGYGGFGIGLHQLPFLGGAPGPRLFLDGKSSNDFWGVAIDVNSRKIIRGEIAWPFGGSGGGGGGDRWAGGSLSFTHDSKGAGGGGGGGAVLIYALGKIVVGPAGRISADGGDGGGGEWAGSSRFGGGGGGGSGGMVILMTRKTIDLHVHGKTYGEGDYSFSVSADGGIGRQSRFGAIGYESKYAGDPSSAWSRNAGGLGGMGIVQFVTPVDGKNADGTNTILDDKINILQNGKPLTGAVKQKYLAWRGFPNSLGVRVDDRGKAIQLGHKDGDIRPAPHLLPLWF